MGRIVVSEFVSVDGVMEAPGGEPGYRHTGWVARFPDLGQFAYKLEETQAAEALLLGHTTYRGFAGAWPKRDGDFADKMNAMPKYVVSSTLRDPEWHNTTVLLGHTTYRGFASAWPQRDGDFAEKMNAMPKYVVSSTLRDPTWHNTTVLQGPVAESVARLKSEVQGELLVAGSRTLVQALRAHDLVDEYRLMVFPIVLGSGMRVFEDSEDAAELELTAARSFGSVALLTYQPVRGDSTPDTSARAVDRFVKDVLKTQQ